NWSELREHGHTQAAGIGAAHDDGKTVVEAERRQYFQVEAASVFAFHQVKDLLVIGERFFFQNCSERRSGVFHLHVDAPGQERLVAYVSSREIETANHAVRSYGL